MRVVVLSSSIYSESACAMAAHLAQSGYVPAGLVALRTVHAGTLIRKAGQWGVRGSIDYAAAKLLSRGGRGDRSKLRNGYLAPFLAQGNDVFCNLQELAGKYGFPLAFCGDQNSRASITQIKTWSPDIIVFAGGNILRQSLLGVPRLGVLNAHLALLPQIRGMSSPEWSLLTGVPPGVTIHFMDRGIDTGPILERCELPDAGQCHSLADLCNRLIAFGVEKMVGVVAGLDRGEISTKSSATRTAASSGIPSAIPQFEYERDRQEQGNRKQDTQFFVMHEWLQARAGERLTRASDSTAPDRVHG